MALRKRVAVVADDITGANDIGIMFAKGGMKVAVMPFKRDMNPKRFNGYDVVVLDTDSRFDTPDVAAGKVKAATSLLLQSGFDLYHNKTCSVFRGNIGAEFDAMQDVLCEKWAMIVLGFPKLLRTTVAGVHYLDGQLLENSPFQNDPIHPTRESRLQKILAKQSHRKSALFTYDMLDQPDYKQRECLNTLKKDNAYIIFDVRDQKDLKTIARLITSERNICGSSAIAEELPQTWGYEKPKAPVVADEFNEDGLGTLVLAGSLTVATAEQIACFQKNGQRSLEMDPFNLMAGDADAVLALLIAQACQAVSKGENILIHSSNKRETVLANKEKARALGMNDEALGRLISGAMGYIAKSVLDHTGSRKLVVAGGDTSMAVNEALGIDLMQIVSEIEPGVPAMVGLGNERRYAVVYKSGSFGSADFFFKAIRAINLNNRGERMK